ncbi:MAG: divalent-cation tolerance protein CutA [Gammaproteobacteria bacterium]
MSTSTAIIALCTCPDAETAERLARAVVEARHAACVNVIEGVRSVYRWEGAVTSDREVLLVAKTTAEAWPGLAALWREAHPYELPEIIAVPVTLGSADYLTWLSDSVSS